MRPVESFIAQPVRSLQTMLRVIAQENGQQPSLIPDGIYGSQTMQAVTAFQRNNGLPATGITDQATWEAIVAIYEPAAIRVGPAQPLEIILEPGQVLHHGDQAPNIYILQAVLQVLSDAYDSITPPTHTGILDDATVISIQTFQELNGLPQTGEADKLTWKQLALHYPLASNNRRFAKPNAGMNF
jgi:peptidoglycan hydrolase-like protein with peptidoglycan-binding domain